MSDRLFVGVPADRIDPDPGTGAGRVWHGVLPYLRQQADIRPITARRRPLRRRPDVWLTTGEEPVGSPLVVVVHGAAWLVEERFWELTPPGFAGMVESIETTVRSASFAITPSAYTRRSLVDAGLIDGDRVVAVPHGVDAELFNPDRPGGRALVAAALGEDRPYVLFASIPSIAQKNLRALREAVSALAASGFPHALVIAGGAAGGEPAGLLDELSADLAGGGGGGGGGRVAWLGHVDDHALAGLMAEADAFCLPSLFESFGLTALEAMACGAAAVVSNRGALPEVVGDAALVCDPSPQALAEALARVLAGPALARDLGLRARERALSMTWERTGAAWVDVLRRAAAEGRGMRR